MDKKSGEELASTLDANPSEPIQPAAPAAPVAEPAPAAPVAEPAPVAAPAPAPAPAPVAGPAPVAAAPVKKKKTGLIVGVTIGALAVIGGGTAAAILLLNNNNSGPANPDEAIADSLAGMLTGASTNLGFDGTAKISAQGMNVKINFDGEIADKEGKGNVEVDLSGMGMDITASVNAILKDNVAYIKANGIKEIINKFGLSMFLGSSATKSLQSIDGTWYKLPVTVSTITDYESLIPQGNSSCSIDYEKLLSEREKIAEIYKEHNFVKTEKYTGNDVEKKKSDLYKLNINKDEFASFINEITKKYVTGGSSCKQTVSGSQLDSLDLDDVKVLAEFNKNSISRLYVNYEAASSSSADVTLDVNISTPSSVNVEAPSSAKSADELIESLSPLFGGSISGLGGGSSYGGGYGYDDDDDDNDDDDYDYDSFDYDSLLEGLDSSDYQELLEQLNGLDYSSLLEGLDSSDYQELLDQLGGYSELLEGLDLDDYDSSDLNSALNMIKSLQ